MNESRADRYRRLQRRASSAAVLTSAAVTALVTVSGASRALRDATGGSAAACAVLLTLMHEGVWLPAVWFRTWVLDRHYGVSRMRQRAWLIDHVVAAAILVVAAALAAELLYAAMRAWPVWWWLPASAAAGLALLAAAACWPFLILPPFGRARPVARPGLESRLTELCRRAQTAEIAVYESQTGGTGRAAAALAGLGSTQRILMSDSLLSACSDDELEVVVAHELGHHVHRDVLTSVAAECLVLMSGFLAVQVVLGTSSQSLGLTHPSDPAGIPVVALTLGFVVLVSRPALHALSRRSERRADVFALRHVSNPAAFAGVLRRLASQNLAEERPSRGALWLFHSHPPVDARLAEARLAIALSAAPSCSGSDRPR